MGVGIVFILFFCLGHDLIAEDSLPQISVNQPIKMGEYFDVMDDFIDRDVYKRQAVYCIRTPDFYSHRICWQYLLPKRIIFS